MKHHYKGWTILKTTRPGSHGGRHAAYIASRDADGHVTPETYRLLRYAKDAIDDGEAALTQAEFDALDLIQRMRLNFEREIPYTEKLISHRNPVTAKTAKIALRHFRKLAIETVSEELHRRTWEMTADMAVRQLNLFERWSAGALNPYADQAADVSEWWQAATDYQKELFREEWLAKWPVIEKKLVFTYREE